MPIKILGAESSTHSSIVSALCQNLDPARQQLLRILGFRDFCAVETVACRQRPAGRIIVPAERSETVRSLIEIVGGSAREAPFRLQSLTSPVPGTDHRASVVEAPNGDAVIYFGISRTIAEAAELASISGDEPLVGELFGYPGCCTSFYMDARKSGPDCTALSIRSFGPFPREMNPIVPYLFGPLSFLFHFPCSPDCSESRTLRDQRESLFAQTTPCVSMISSLGTGVALYSPQLGVSLLKISHPVTGVGLHADEILTNSTITQRLFSLRARRLIFTSHNTFSIDEAEYSGPNQFVANFR
jgi:hypothetical protein